MIRVRLVEERDADAIMALFRAHCEEFAAHLGFDEAKARAALDRSLTKGDPVCFVAETGGEIVGYITGRICEYPYSAGHFVQQELLFVRPCNRGTRAAVKLIREFVEWGSIVKAREWFAGTSTGYKPERVARLFALCGGRVAGYSVRGVY